MTLLATPLPVSLLALTLLALRIPNTCSLIPDTRSANPTDSRRPNRPLLEE